MRNQSTICAWCAQLLHVDCHLCCPDSFCNCLALPDLPTTATASAAKERSNLACCSSTSPAATSLASCVYSFATPLACEQHAMACNICQPCAHHPVIMTSTSCSCFMQQLCSQHPTHRNAAAAAQTTMTLVLGTLACALAPAHAGANWIQYVASSDQASRGVAECTYRGGVCSCDLQDTHWCRCRCLAGSALVAGAIR